MAEAKDKVNTPEKDFLQLIKDVLKVWMKRTLIDTIILRNGEEIPRLPEKWGDAYHPAIVIKNRKKIKYTTFITVKQSAPISELTKILREDMIYQDAWVAPKFTANEDVRRIGFLDRVNLRHSCVKWYTKLVCNEIGMVNEEVELKKEKTYERGYNTPTYVVYYVKSKAKEVDQLLRSKSICKFFQELCITYISFSNTPKDVLLKQLH